MIKYKYDVFCVFVFCIFYFFNSVFFLYFFFFFSSRRRHTRFDCDWSSDVCSSDLRIVLAGDYGPCPKTVRVTARERGDQRSVRIPGHPQSGCIPGRSTSPPGRRYQRDEHKRRPASSSQPTGSTDDTVDVAVAEYFSRRRSSDGRAGERRRASAHMAFLLSAGPARWQRHAHRADECRREDDLVSEARDRNPTAATTGWDCDGPELL